jgi:UDP-N-acetylglucosamine--N-acetylmuramyl-(pentapeptide) pyrophosphoryl-undecaprenol N-acetylglucosamine transferase
MGSVSPLLAITKNYPADYLFIGTKFGPEKSVVEVAGLKFQAIISGKLRRYWSFKNFVDIFKIKFAFWQSIFLLLREKPDIVLTAGSFVAVPVAYAAWMLRIPVVIHQQDIQVGLANKLMAPVAKKITVTFEVSKNLFNTKKTTLTGNPTNVSAQTQKDQPTIVITGGGLGARGFNRFLSEFIPKLARDYRVHHILGENNWDQALELENYQAHKFIKQGMIDLLNQADIIVSRAGLSLITEAAALKKALVLIPIPDSHQEKNAEFFAKHNAAIMVRQDSRQIMARYLDKLTSHPRLRQGLGENLYNLFPKNSVDNYVKVIEDILR